MKLLSEDLLCMYMYFSLPIHLRKLHIGSSVFDVAFLLLQSDFNGLQVDTYWAFPNIHPPEITATPPEYESVIA